VVKVYRGDPFLNEFLGPARSLGFDVAHETVRY